MNLCSSLWVKFCTLKQLSFYPSKSQSLYRILECSFLKVQQQGIHFFSGHAVPTFFSSRNAAKVDQACLPPKSEAHQIKSEKAINQPFRCDRQVPFAIWCNSCFLVGEASEKVLLFFSFPPSSLFTISPCKWGMKKKKGNHPGNWRAVEGRGGWEKKDITVSQKEEEEKAPWLDTFGVGRWGYHHQQQQKK